MKKIILIFVLVLSVVAISFAVEGPNGYHLVTYKIGNKNSGGSKYANLRSMQVYAGSCQLAQAIIISKLTFNTVVIISCESSTKNNMAPSASLTKQTRIQR